MATYSELLRENQRLEAQMRASDRLVKRYCFHRQEGGNGNNRGLMSIQDAIDRGFISENSRNRVIYSATSVVCVGANGCEAIFEGARYPKEEIEAMEFQLNSIFEQVKWNAGNPQNFPGGPDKLDDVCIALDVIHSLCLSYREMCDAIANQNDRDKRNPKKKNRNNSGGFSTPNLYGRG